MEIEQDTAGREDTNDRSQKKVRTQDQQQEVQYNAFNGKPMNADFNPHLDQFSPNTGLHSADHRPNPMEEQYKDNELDVINKKYNDLRSKGVPAKQAMLLSRTEIRRAPKDGKSTIKYESDDDEDIK
ncbi:hypothetical protein ScalyP_jg8325 [Parmales sp. scaly parma]|jgi:hypothetical protein|nr:hypothetical protein ScalyP_jg8325 [Parmales sp. scaly parma]